MGINVRTKGQTGEREIATALNKEVAKVRLESELPKLDKRDELFQRNQNQSAVGGDDLTNPLGLSIEVKRQENLSLNAWWKQTTKSADRQPGNFPILIYRKNRQKWRCRMMGGISLEKGNLVDPELYLDCICVDISFDDFLLWFRHYYRIMLATSHNC